MVRQGKNQGQKKRGPRMWFRRRREKPGSLPPELMAPNQSESFIPVPRTEIAARLVRAEAWPEGMSPQVTRLFRYLAAWRHIRYNEVLDKLDAAYDLFAPDSDFNVDQTRTMDEIVATRADFLVRIRDLLDHANFREIPREKLDGILTRDSQYGLDLHVDFDDYETLMVYWRGSAQRTSVKRANFMFWKKITKTYPIYRRLFLLMKLKPREQRIREIMAADKVTYQKAAREVKSRRKMLPVNSDEEAIFLKMFKDIPLSDMEMMFPNTKIKFRSQDKLMLGLSAGGSIGGVLGPVVMKLVAAASILAALPPAAIGALALAMAGVIYRQVNGMLNQRRQYLAVLAQNLYFHTLADNRAAITLLASRAEEEDVKEEMLLYSMLVKEEVFRAELLELKQALVRYLQKEFDVTVDFDCEEALGRLIKDGVVKEHADGRLEALDPARGIEHLDGLWDGYLNPKGDDRRLSEEA
jgi:Protein of unknown function (DUF3754)